MTEAELIQLSSEFEGHPDNAVGGGARRGVVSWTATGRRPRYAAAPLRLHPDIRLFSRHSRAAVVDRRDPGAAAAAGQPRRRPVQRQPRRAAGRGAHRATRPADGGDRGRAASAAAGRRDAGIGGISAGYCGVVELRRCFPVLDLRFLRLSTRPELPAEALEFGAANGFTVSEMSVGDGVRWTSGVPVRS